MARSLLPLVVLLCAPLVGCGHDPEPMPGSGVMIEPPEGGFEYELELGREGPMRGHIQGVQVEIERNLVLESPELAKSAVTGYSMKGTGQPELKLRVGVLRIDDGVVRIGERDYGKVAAGKKLEITSAGVAVGGEVRGPLP